MTDEAKPQEQSAKDENEPSPKIDHMLQFFVMNANAGINVSITLNICGAVVTGLLIGINEYLDSVAALYRKPENIKTIGVRPIPEEGDEEIGLRNAEQTASFIDSLRVDFAKELKETGTVTLSRMVHLKNARINGVPTADGIWRGKLSSVDGFAFGAPV